MAANPGVPAVHSLSLYLQTIQRQQNTVMSRLNAWLLVCYLALSVPSIQGAEEEQCHTFAGGAVYPNTEGRASGHNLQWTTARSNYCVFIIFIALWLLILLLLSDVCDVWFGSYCVIVSVVLFKFDVLCLLIYVELMMGLSCYFLVNLPNNISQPTMIYLVAVYTGYLLY